MPEGSMTLLHGSTTRVSVTELAEIIDTDPTTIDNWLRRKIITRAPLWGRKLTKRLFSAEEIYKISLTFAEKRMSKEASINSLLCLGRMYEVFGRQMEADTAFARAERLFEDAQPQA